MARRRVSPITLRAWAGFALIVLLVLGSAFVVGAQLRGAAEARRSVERTGDRIDRLNLLLRHVLDAEVGQRGYIISGNPLFLTPYHESVREVEATLRAIAADARPSPVEQRRYRRLRDFVGEKFAFIDRSIEVRRAQGLDAAATLVQGLEGKRLMDVIRGDIDDMIAYERRDLAARTRALQDEERLTQQVVFVALGGALVLVLAIGLMLMRSIRDQIAAQRAARHGATLMRITLDNIGAAVLIVGADGEIVGHNGELQRLVPHIDAAVVPEEIEAELAMAREGRPFLFERPIGDYEVAVVRGVPLPGGRFLVTYLDIGAARRADRVKTEFVTTVSHELRTPVTSIRGALGMLAGPLAAGLTDKQRSLADMALRNAERLGLLVNDILDMEKIESGRMEFDIQSCDLNQLLQDAADTNRAYAEARGILLALGTLPRPVRVDVDAHRIQQVMANLISNAVKFSEAGGIVTLTAEEDGDMARVSVHDRGPGIPEAFKARIFERFAQADSADTRAKGGTGLGLSIAQAIVERHGGTLTFDSKPGDTFFTFSVPLSGGDAGAARTAGTSS